ncbi:MAG: hypothetical protein EBX39_02250 [Actinobacteria bacterium]|nr:hypothetical protein [Actinomycetota bacterium]
MTEVPEHLLKRSKDRRSALSGEAPSAEAPAASTTPADDTGSAVEAAPTAPAKVAAAAPAVSAEPEFVPPYVEAALKRKKIPFWAMPVLAFLPVWVFIYIGGLSPASDGKPTQLAQGQAIYTAQCAGCHGSGGGGGVGRPMTDGNLIKTFPDILGQLQFVWLGSNGMGPAGTPYGDPNREGGQHTTLSYNGNPMPAFNKSLKPAELLAVVRYEREVLSGYKLDPTQIDAKGQLTYGNSSPYLDAEGQLVTPEGKPLFDADGRLTIEPNWTMPVGSK